MAGRPEPADGTNIDIGYRSVFGHFLPEFRKDVATLTGYQDSPSCRIL